MYELYRQLRDAKDITDYEVAKLTGISTATLSSWKNGAYTPKMDKIALIADLFGVPLEDFVEAAKSDEK